LRRGFMAARSRRFIDLPKLLDMLVTGSCTGTPKPLITVNPK